MMWKRELWFCLVPLLVVSCEGQPPAEAERTGATIEEVHSILVQRILKETDLRVFAEISGRSFVVGVYDHASATPDAARRGAVLERVSIRSGLPVLKVTTTMILFLDAEGQPLRLNEMDHESPPDGQRGFLGVSLWDAELHHVSYDVDVVFDAAEGVWKLVSMRQNANTAR